MGPDSQPPALSGLLAADCPASFTETVHGLPESYFPIQSAYVLVNTLNSCVKGTLSSFAI